MDRGAWWAAVHGVAESRSWLSDFTFTFHFHALEKEMATHSCVLAWRSPGTGGPGGLPSMRSHKAGHDWSDLASAAAAAAHLTLPLWRWSSKGAGREVRKQHFPPSLYLTFPASPAPTCFYQFHFMNQDGNFLTWLSSREVGEINTETCNKIAILPFKWHAYRSSACQGRKWLSLSAGGAGEGCCIRKD